ncbi:MAG: fluoride efflux transporter FluC [Paracoccaceae bacterium]
MEKVLLVAAGGALGSVLRFLSVSLLGRLTGDAATGTLLVNVAGSFLMGCLFVLLIEHSDGVLSRLMPFLSVGLLGSFTTFSAFSLDALRLFESGKPWVAGFYVLGSVSLSIVAVIVGVAVMRAQSA